MTAAEFLAAFPDIETNFGTGGNCTAWNLTLMGTCYVLITSHDYELTQPALADRRAMFGICNDGESVEPRIMTWAQAARWLTGIIDFHNALSAWGPRCLHAPTNN